MPFTRKVKFPLTNHVDVTGIAHANLFESEYSRLGLAATGGGLDVYTKLLLHCNGADTSPTFTDETGKTVTSLGNAQIDTAQSVFGGASGLFDGTGDGLSVPDSEDWNFGTSDFTIDFRVRWNVMGATSLFAQGESNTYRYYLYYGNTGDLRFHSFIAGVEVIATVWAWTPVINTWYHLAVVRTGATFRMYVNGTQVGADYLSSGTVDGGANPLTIATSKVAGEFVLNGWIDEFRVSKGIARWIVPFTLPTSEYTRSYPTNSPSPATTWTALKTGDVIDMSTAKAWMYKDGVVQAAGNTDVTFKYAANNGGDSAAKTLTQLRAETDVMVTNETNSFKIYGLYASDGLYKSESETWIELNVVSAADGGGGKYDKFAKYGYRRIGA